MAKALQDAQTQMQTSRVLTSEAHLALLQSIDDLSPKVYPVTTAALSIGFDMAYEGYFLYRDNNPNAFISAIAPTFETHVNIPLNHRGVFQQNDPAGTASVVDLTYGVNVLFGRTAMVTAAFVNPVTGPRPFSYEWQLFLNIYYGRTRSRASQITPPLGGG